MYGKNIQKYPKNERVSCIITIIIITFAMNEEKKVVLSFCRPVGHIVSVCLCQASNYHR
jgi:hypothetical protein